MKNKMKIGICSALLVGSLIGTTDLAQASSNDVNAKVAQQVVSQFKDVNKGYYSFDAINFAKERGIVDGYPDGTFKPNNPITESQFAKMLAEFMGLKDNKGDLVNNKYTSGSHWSDTYYDGLASYNVPLNGYFDNGLRNKPVKRGVVAQAIGSLTGNASTLKDSIYFMLDEGLTTGQNPQFEGKDLNKFFGTHNNLTRGQVAAFLYRMHNVSVDEPIGNAIDAYENKDGLSLVGQANKGINTLDKSLRLGKLGSETPGNGGGNNNGGNNNGGNTENPSKTDSEYIEELKTLVGEKNIQMLENKGFEFESTKQQSTGTVSVGYSYNKNGYGTNIFFYMKDGKLEKIGSDYAHDGVKELYANLMGISKSKLTGGASDMNIKNNKYYIKYTTGSYNLYLK